MTKINHIRKSLLMMISIILSTAIFAAPGISQKMELQQINHQIQQLQTTLDHTHQQQTDLEQRLKASELLLATITQDINQLTQQEINEQYKLVQLEKQKQALQVKINHQRDTLAKQVAAAYQIGKMNHLKIVFNQENLEKVNRHLAYYRYITQERVTLMAAIKESLQQITETMQSINEHEQTLKHLLQQKQRQQVQLANAQKLRQQLMNQLSLDAQSKEQQLATLTANQKALEEAVSQVMAQPINLVTSSQPFSQQQGKLPWPVKGTLISTFGSPLDVGNQHLPGVIIKAPYGNPVHAISAGKVIFANWLRGFGLLIIINHGNGYMSLYARNGSLTVSVGDKVKSGDIIATIGNTGGHKTPSLYFEIRQNGIPTNPSQWCRYT